MNFISFTGGVLIAVLMVGAMFVMYSCLNSYQMRMMEQIRKIKNKVYDLEQKLDNHITFPRRSRGKRNSPEAQLPDRAVRQVAPALLTAQEDDPALMHKLDRM